MFERIEEAESGKFIGDWSRLCERRDVVGQALGCRPIEQKGKLRARILDIH
jgi:hypothetical protein